MRKLFIDSKSQRLFSIVSLLMLLSLFSTSVLAAPPTFSKVFSPDTIGVGGTSTLTFTIDNSNEPESVRNLAFTDNLPAGVLIESPANASLSPNCRGELSAPDGGTVVSFSNGGVGAGESCTILVDVTSSVVGTHTNVSGDLTSDAGNSGSATADLTVSESRPAFSKAFAPSTVFLGGKSTLTFLIDNTANGIDAIELSFVDNLPSGMQIASPANASTTCSGGTLSAIAGDNVISYSPFPFSFVDSGENCTVTVDVVANAIGTLTNTSGELTSRPPTGGTTVSSGVAVADLTVTVEQISLTKAFVDDPVAPGGTVTLELTIRNLNRTDSATDITFSDDLGAALSGLEATGLPASDVCGTGSQIAGTGVITLTGGNLAAEATCTFSVSLTVPTGTADGSYINTTSSITADIAGSPVTGDPASDELSVVSAPVLTKEFTNDPVGSGGSVDLVFTITNTSAISTATDITFFDEFDVILPSASSIPANDFCGTGSQATFIPASSFDPARLIISGASLGASSSCAFTVTLDISPAASAGNYLNATSEISAVLNGGSVTGAPATDTLQIYSAPQLIKEFTDDPVAPGDPVTLQFRLVHDEDAPTNATSIAFTDDLDATLSGLVATGLPVSDVCGTGSQIDGTATLAFTNGTLAPGEECSFDVTLQVPALSPSGFYTNVTSAITAVVDDAVDPAVTATGNIAEDDLVVAGLTLTKEFTDDPALPGGNVTLQFTLTNSSTVTDGTTDATNIVFTDDLDKTLDGLAGDGTPVNDVCGTGSSLSWSAGNTNLIFQDGSLDAGLSCTFSTVLTVPASAGSGIYGNTTSLLSADIGGNPTVLNTAFDELTVSSDFLALSKEFTDDPVAPGGLVILEFTIENLSASQTVTNISFSDDLGAALTGMTTVSGTQTGVCGTSSELDGTTDPGKLAFTGGSLAPATSCTFVVTVSIPSDVSFDTPVTNITTQVEGDVGGTAVTGNEATADLELIFVELSKNFVTTGDVFAGDSVELEFTITNKSASDGIDDLSFVDDLDAVLSGLAATGLPVPDVCGTGSQLDGTSVISLSNASLLPAGSCTFSVILEVPDSAPAGSYLNTTSELQQQGIPVSAPAVAELVIVDANPDLDNDGVLDAVDMCPGTVIPENVPTRALCYGRYALVDGDGIFDVGTEQGGACRNFGRASRPDRGSSSSESFIAKSGSKGSKGSKGKGSKGSKGNRGRPRPTFTINDTAGCSCEQIIDELGVGHGHEKFGCSVGLMKRWIYSRTRIHAIE